MISLTLPTGEAGWLALYPPEMSGGMTLRVTSRQYDERGATGREARRPTDPTVTCELDWQAELAGADVTAVLAALLAYQNEPVVMPCWPLAVAGTAYSYGTTPQGGYMIAWTEAGSYAFFSGAVSSPTSWDWIAPLLYGYFADTPKATASQGDFVRYSFKFAEDSPMAYALGPWNTAATASGPAIGGFTPPGFPFPLDWAQSPESGAAGVVVTRDQVGPGRRTIQTFFPNVAERKVNGQVTLPDPWPLLCWWNSQGGGVQSQWVTTGLQAGLLTADAASGASVVNLASQSGVVAGAILAFDVMTGTADTVFFRKVASVAGAAVTLTGTLPAACPKDYTVVSRAMLGRHASDTLTITEVSPDIFQARLDWVELAAEYAVPSGETLGTTLGRKQARPWLLEISSVQPVAEVLWRITDWSAGITLADTRVFTYQPLEIGERQRNIDLADQQLKITLPWVAGSPLAHFLPGQSYRRLFVTLYYVPVAADGTVGTQVQDWYGEIIDCEYAGPRMDLTVTGPNNVFDRQVPADSFGKTCNAHLFDSRCGVDKASWTVSGTVVSASGGTVVFGSASRPGGTMTPLQVAGAFQLGSLQWVDAGVTKIMGIYASSYSGGNYTLTMREPITITAGASVTVIPGCDLQWTGGCARYSGKFRGFPHIPARAPQFMLPTQTTSQGKK